MGKRTKIKQREARQELPDFRLAWPLTLVGLAAAIGFAVTLGYEFVYDDVFQVVMNTWIRSWDNVGRLFTHHVWAFWDARVPSGYYRPLHMLLYMVTYSIGGPDAHVFHLANILLHALCSVFVALIGIRLTGKRSIGIAGGLLFALHPVHSESVTWIAGVTDPLCAAFYFPALYFHIKGGEDGNRRLLALSAAFFLAAMFSKEMALTFPLVALWLDWCLKRKIRWSHYLVLAGMFCVYALMRVIALGSFFVEQNRLPLSSIGHILSRIVLVAEYEAKAFIPYGISAFHVFEPTTSMGNARSLISLGLLGAIGGAAWFLRKQRMALFLGGFTLLTLVPVLNLTGIGENVFAERYLYIPTLGSCLLVPLLAAGIPKILPRLKPLSLHAGAVLLGIVLLASGWKLQKENSVWHDEETLFTTTMKRSPKAAPIAYSLGAYYLMHNDSAKAHEWATRAYEARDQSFIKKKSTLVQIYSLMGRICLQEEKVDCTREFLAKIEKEAPDSDMLLVALATYYVRKQEFEEALSLFEKIMNVNPRSESACVSAAGLCVLLKRYDQAVAYSQKALELNSNSAGSWENLASAYTLKGMKREAIYAFEKVKELDPSKSGIADIQIRQLELRR